MPAHGGKRPGAGRKPGSQTVKTRAIAEKLGAEGISPLEVLMSAMRIAWQRSVAANHAGDDLAMAITCAEKAAPYMHPKLGAITHQGDPAAPIQHEHNVTLSAEHDARLRELLGAGPDHA